MATQPTTVITVTTEVLNRAAEILGYRRQGCGPSATRCKPTARRNRRRSPRVKWHPINGGRNLRAHVNGMFGTVLSTVQGHFAYVSGGKLESTKCKSREAAKRLAGRVLRGATK